MRTVPGTAEVNSWGGYEKQYQIRIDPERLIKHDLTFDRRYRRRSTENNFNVGGGNISQAGGMLLVQGLGRTDELDQIQQIVISAKDGVPIRVGDVADVAIGHEIRRGAVTADGQGEVGARPGLHADGRKQPRRHLGPEGQARSRSSRRLPPNVQVETGLRPHASSSIS